MKRAFLRLVVVMGVAVSLTGCVGVSYYAQALGGHAKIMAERRDVAAVIGDPATPKALRGRLETARAIRQFATDRLALPDNDSYRDFVDVHRDYVSVAVYAAPEFSLAPNLWCFAVFGCVPYLGHFSEQAAARQATELRRQGLDVYATGVIAYSTLGWSSDPLLNTMLGPDETSLAGLVFHELAHSEVYVEGDSAFNEAFAVAVETTGVEKWLRATGNGAGLRRYEAERKREADFLTLVSQARSELGRIYDSAETPARKREQKAAAIERLRTRYRQMRDSRWGGYRGYDGWFDAPINNAQLAATAVYSERVPAFLRLFNLCSDDYPRFYTAVRRIGALDQAHRGEALDAAKTCD